MTEPSDENLQALRHEVERLLGSCLLNLQRYEILMKVLLGERDISGAVQSHNDTRVAPTTDVRRKTLGTLAGEFLGDYLTSDGNAEAASPPVEDGSASFRIRLRVELSPDDFTQTESSIKELVLLRNNLVHHFVEQYDLRSADGCRRAESALIAASDQIKHSLDSLREEAIALARLKQLAAEAFNTEGILDDLIHDRIPWCHTVIAIALQEAADDLARDGWASVAEAVDWVLARYPEELPEHYGCRSWHQVLQVSGLFELHRQPGDRRATQYRVRTRSSNLH